MKNVVKQRFAVVKTKLGVASVPVALTLASSHASANEAMFTAFTDWMGTFATAALNVATTGATTVGLPLMGAFAAWSIGKRVVSKVKAG